MKMCRFGVQNGVFSRYIMVTFVVFLYQAAAAAAEAAMEGEAEEDTADMAEDTAEDTAEDAADLEATAANIINTTDATTVHIIGPMEAMAAAVVAAAAVAAAAPGGGVDTGGGAAPVGGAAPGVDPDKTDKTVSRDTAEDKPPSPQLKTTICIKLCS